VELIERKGTFAKVRLPDGTVGFLAWIDLEPADSKPDAPAASPVESPATAPTETAGTPKPTERTGTIRQVADVGGGTTIALNRPDWIDGVIVARPRVGTTVTILDERNGFLQVRLPDGIVAWVTKSDIEEKTAPSTDAFPYTAVIRAEADAGEGATVLLSQPTWASTSQIIGRPPVGVTVTVLEKSGDFLKVRLANGTEGWLDARDLVRK
jgi:SH3-like domain-containing protein